MNAPLAERAMQLFEQVFELEGEARAEAIRQACRGDEDLRREIDLLLDHSVGIEIIEPEPANPDADLVFSPRPDERYELLDEIGRGGMGIVYRAVDSQLNRTVAIKVMRPVGSGPAAIRRFSAEAQIAASLQHPGVPPIYDAGILPDGRPFLAMKLVEGQTLGSLLSARTEQSDDRARLIDAFASLCQVIAYAHSREVVHRDLKPDNVMVGEFGQVQVMDWGLAKALVDRDSESAESDQPAKYSPSSKSSPTSRETRFGEVMGTPAYMPPEQLVGKRSKQTDVFALGAILCEILTGHPPYTANSPAEILSKSATADLAEANRRLDQCGADPELVRIARQCLLPELEHRPAEGAEVAGRVSAHLQTVQARLREAEMARARSEARAIEQQKRRRVQAMLLATATLLVIVLLSGWGWISHRETTRVRNQAIRQASMIERISRSKTEAIRLRQAAEDSAIDDFSAWAAAETAINQAQSLLDPSTPEDLAEEINALATQIASQASDRKLLADIEQAREDSLEQITVTGRPEPSVRQRRDEHLATVFRDTPFKLGAADKRSAQQFVSGTELAVKEALIGAIDEWIVACDSISHRRWLAETIASVDDNPWRLSWREAAVQGDVMLLRALLDNEQTFEQSPRSVLNLCWSVKEIEPGINTQTTLQRVYRHHVEDFWLNCALGDQALERGSSHLAAQHYQYALGMRPMSCLHREIGGIFLATGWHNDALYHLQRALELNDRSATSWELIAVTYFQLGRLDEAGAAFERAKSMLSNDLRRVMDYVNFLDRTGQRSKGIEYLRRRQASQRGWSSPLHRRLVELLYYERHYLQAIEEFRRYSERTLADPMLNVTLAEAAIMVADGHGTDAKDLPMEQRNHWRRQSHDWLQLALDSWASRRTAEPVLRQIAIRRNKGSFDSVFRQDAIAMLPPHQQTAWREFWSRVAEEERQLDEFDISQQDMNAWTIFEPESIASATGAVFERLPDGSFLVSGPTDERDVYTLTRELDLTGIYAIRLDVIADERLPRRGPGRHSTGNFHLAEIELWIEDESSQRQRLFDRTIASYSWQDRPISNAIDGDRHTIWHVWGKLGYSQTARFFLNKPLTRDDGKRLTIRLVHGGDGVNATLGRFRLSYQRALPGQDSVRSDSDSQ